MMDPSVAVIWMFLVIFALTALVTLGALVGLVKMEPYFLKKLFTLLILQVVGSVVGYAAWAFQAARSASVDLRSLLLSPQYGWDWQYAQANWRSRIYFTAAGNGRIAMNGETSLVDANGKEQTIMTWGSAEPFELKKNAQTVTFKAWRMWSAAGATAYPSLKWEVGKKVDAEITIHPEIGLEGQSRDNGAANSWGMMMTPAFP
jgi:hypothetical protein